MYKLINANQGKVIEILIILMKEIKQRGMAKEQMRVLSGELLNRGYTEQEISSAFTYIIERFGSDLEGLAPDPKSFRVLHDFERIFISADAYGYLLQLSALGLVSAEEVERIIERAVLTSIPNMKVEEMKPLVGEVLFGTGENFNLESGEYSIEDLIQ
jgi:uncharacterized protein Smg (DUF494 family)